MGKFKKCINPTTRGRFINSTYYINANSNMDTCCGCGSDPSVNIPVLIIPPLLEPPRFEEPEEW